MTERTEEAASGDCSADNIVGFLKQVFSASPLGVCLIDPEMVIRWANGAFAQQVGASVEEVIGRPAESIMPGWTGQAGDLYSQARETREPQHWESSSGVSPDRTGLGTKYWNSSITPLFGRPGEFDGWLLMQNEVTEQKRMQSRLAYLASFPERSLNPVVEVDLAGGVRYMNPASRRLFPTLPEEGLAHSWLRDWARAVGPFQKRQSETETREVTVGERSYHQALYYVAESGFVRVYGIDITARRRAEEERERLLQEVQVQNEELQVQSEEIQGQNQELESQNEELAQANESLEESKRALAESEARYRAVGELIPYGVWMCNAAGENTYVSDYFLRLTGSTMEQIRNSAWLDLMPKEDRERTRAAWKHYVETEGAETDGLWESEHRFYGRDGLIYTVISRGVAMRDEEGRATGYVGSHIDITERKRVEEEREGLRKLAERRAAELDTVIEATGAGIAIYDAEGGLVRLNPAGQKIMSYGPEDIAAPYHERVWRTQLQKGEGTPMALEETPPYRALHGETVAGSVVGIRRHGRRVWTWFGASPIRSGDGSVIGAVASFVDITEQRELEKLRDEFLGMAAHELKTPVTSIKGYAQLLLRKASAANASGEVEIFQTINRQCDRLNRLVEELLEVSRLRHGQLELHKEKVLLSEFLVETMQDLPVLSPKHEVLCRDCEGAAARVEIDRDRLEQVVTNLITNAIRYSPQGGEIEVRLTCRDGQAIVAVTDHGVGIPKDRQPRIFEHFYRAHANTPNDYGGMGVGLFISREIIKRHGGDMWLESEEGEGSTFYFSLPLA